MAQVIQGGIPATAVKRRPSGRKYDWGTWCDGQTRRLVRGEDFKDTIKPSAFKAQFANACDLVGKDATWGYEGENVIYIQAIERES